MIKLIVKFSLIVTIFVLAFYFSTRVMKMPEEKMEGGQIEETYAAQAMKWYNDQRAYPTGKIPVDWRAKALQTIEKAGLNKTSALTQLTWSSVGPNNIGGRVRSLAIDSTNPSIMYCGSVSGGIWKTTDGGASWSPLTDNANNLVIGCMAIDPTNHNIIYAGTGEGFFNLDALRGAGVLKSTDAGATWTLLTNFATPNASFGYYYINKIIVRADNHNVIYAAMLGGIWKTTDAGASWTKLNTNTQVSVRCTDLVADPTNADIMYAAFGLFSTDGIYKTTDGGTTWSKVATNFPPITDKYVRISLGISRSSPQTLYASVSDSNSYTHSIQKTTNGGASWFAVTKPVDPLTGLSHLGGQGWYNNVIAVNPTDPNTVYAGGINLFKSTDGGTSWTMVSNWYSGGGRPVVHADQHVIMFDPTNAANIYFGNDGGLFRSTTAGASFVTLNNNLAITQFYSVAVHPSSEIYYGGTQDNGTLKSGTLPAWTISLGGDGGATAVDPNVPTTVYTEYVYLAFYKSTNSGSTWSIDTTGLGGKDRVSFIAPFVMDPSSSSTLVAGTYRVFRTVNGGSSWSPISTDLTGDGAGGVGSAGSTITALGIAKTSSATIYIGTSGSFTATSLVQVTTNTGTSWTNITTATLPDRSVTSLAVDPANASRAFVGFSGYNANTPGTPGHIFLTTNRGTSWTDVSGNLPDIPVNAVLVDPSNTNDIVVGTDLGIFQSVTGGTTWSQQNNGLANVAVEDLALRGDGALFAATHGRGMYKLTTLTGVTATSPELPKTVELKQNYPNPFNPTTHIEFHVPNSGFVSLKVFDVAGREVATLINTTLQPGIHTASWDASNKASGVYYYRLEAGGVTQMKKMMLVK